MLIIFVEANIVCRRRNVNCCRCKFQWRFGHSVSDVNGKCIYNGPWARSICRVNITFAGSDVRFKLKYDPIKLCKNFSTFTAFPYFLAPWAIIKLNLHLTKYILTRYFMNRMELAYTQNGFKNLSQKFWDDFIFSCNLKVTFVFWH